MLSITGNSILNYVALTLQPRSQTRVGHQHFLDTSQALSNHVINYKLCFFSLGYLSQTHLQHMSYIFQTLCFCYMFEIFI